MIKLYLIDVENILTLDCLKKLINILPKLGVWQNRIDYINSINDCREKNLSLGATVGLFYLFKKHNIDYKLLSVTDKGKLYADGEFHFNISHSERYVVFSVGDYENGIDIERVDIYNESVIEHFFSENEREFVNKNIMSFSRLWTLKESYIKALGEGLYKDIKAFEISYEISLDKAFVDGANYCFDDLVYNDYRIAVCGVEEVDRRINIIDEKILNYII